MTTLLLALVLGCGVRDVWLDTGPTDEDGDGWTIADGDCDDGNPAVHPGKVEVCNGKDEDCDGQVDEGGAMGESVWCVDGDGDGFGDPGHPTSACDPPAGYLEDCTDCNDADPAFHPGATEDDCTDPNDYNCDGSVYADVDRDGWAACEECDDADPNVNPGESEVCDDGIDNDCDGIVDDGSEPDADGDGFQVCKGDCDDADPDVHPEAVETWYDGVDQDCDGNDSDQDLDGYDAQEAGGDDCDDENPGANPGASELCNTADDDCDGDVDEGYEEFDVDGDGTADCRYAYEGRYTGTFSGTWSQSYLCGGPITHSFTSPVSFTLDVDADPNLGFANRYCGADFTAYVADDASVYSESSGIWRSSVSGSFEDEHTLTAAVSAHDPGEDGIGGYSCSVSGTLEVTRTLP